jgi:hypothetical protein
MAPTPTCIADGACLPPRSSCRWAVFAGRLYGRDHALIIALEATGALVVGLLVAVGQTTADIGTITLVTLIVFAASSAPYGRAISSALLALAGGCVQTTLSLALWPVRRYAPESRALGALYTELALRTEEDAPATERILAARAAPPTSPATAPWKPNATSPSSARPNACD